MSHVLVDEWEIDLERGPKWLFVRLLPPQGKKAIPQPQLAMSLWEVMEREFTYRLVLEMDSVQVLHSYLVGQLLLLNRQIEARGGVLRICGLSEANREVVRMCHLEKQLTCYPSRMDVLKGHSAPTKPR